MMRTIIAISLLFWLSIPVMSQNITPVEVKYFNTGYDNEKIKIKQSSELKNYVESYVGLNKKRRGFPGYRVKIFAQNSASARNQANSMRIEFENKQTKHKAYVTYVEPNFEVHVGDFTNRFEAVAFLDQISGKYPEAYIIKTIISYPKLEKKAEQ
ncbi:hypothetical protein LJC11_04135 [Bacteroidales bacterium OttesenSCG-928-I21]|nr:hypothetical protein [Bacteroidales bacterium OttesenSCG-928-I21]